MIEDEDLTPSQNLPERARATEGEGRQWESERGNFS